MTSDARQADLASAEPAADALIARNPAVVLVDTASDTVIDTVARAMFDAVVGPHGVKWDDVKSAWQDRARAVLAKLRETAQ